jgi:hypothetical protein
MSAHPNHVSTVIADSEQFEPTKEDVFTACDVRRERLVIGEGWETDYSEQARVR